MMHNWRPAERFDSILDTCLDQLDQSAPEHVLRRYPQAAPQLAPILPIAAQLRRMRELGLSPQAKQRGRAQLRRAVLAYQGRQARTWFGSSLGTTAVWAAVLIVMLAVSLVSVTAASARALPNERLYGWKRAGEELWFSVQPSTEQKIDVAVWLADRRVQETQQLYQRTGTIDEAVVTQIEQAYSRTLGLIATLPRSEEQTFLARVQSLGAQHQAELTALADRASGADQQHLRVAVRASEWVQRASPSAPLAPPTAEPTQPPFAPTSTPTTLPASTPTVLNQDNANEKDQAPDQTAQPDPGNSKEDRQRPTTPAPSPAPATTPPNKGKDNGQRNPPPKQPGNGRGTSGKPAQPTPPAKPPSDPPGKDKGNPGGANQPPPPQPTARPDDGKGGGKDDGKGSGKGKGKP